ncbi:MAG: hypothetical protein GON13_03120 [Nanoarchaeota archaeon]|nr:hypothetical protein [Nanoarchaeota archaeon]
MAINIESILPQDYLSIVRYHQDKITSILNEYKEHNPDLTETRLENMFEEISQKNFENINDPYVLLEQKIKQETMIYSLKDMVKSSQLLQKQSKENRELLGH